MTSHYHLLVAIHLVSLLVFKVSPSPTSYVPNANLDLKSTHHAVTQNPDCDKPVGNPFDILPSFSMGLTGNENPSVDSKSPALFGDDNTQIKSEMKDTYDIGAYSAVCWSRIVTTVEDQNGRLINNLTEYAISFETPGDIPNNYLAEYSIEAHNNKYVKKSVQVPITHVRRSGDNTVTERRYITCSSGPLYSRTLVQYKNNKKKLEIRVSPKQQLLTDAHKDQEENKSLLGEFCEDISNGEDDEKTTAIKEELLWQIIKDILGMNSGQNITDTSSYTNLTELINNKRDELIEKIEEIMPDNVNKTDSILDETIQKIKQDELQSYTTISKVGVSKIYTSQWGTSTNSESATSTEEVGGSVLKKQNATTSEYTTPIYVSVDLTNNDMGIESSALVRDTSTNASYETTQSYSTLSQQAEQTTFTIRVTEFMSYRRGVILDEIMRHMNTYCYDISKNILEIECPSQLDAVPTINSTKLPSFASYKYVQVIPESTKRNNFIVTDPKEQTCYILVKAKKVQCPLDTSKLLNLRIVTYAGNQQMSTTTMTTTENPTSMNTNWNKRSTGYDTTNKPIDGSETITILAPQTENTEAGEFDTFTIRVTEFVSYRRGVILDEIMRHMNTYCYDVFKNILEIECPAQVDTVPTIDKTKIPSFASYRNVQHLPEPMDQNNIIVTDPTEKACYVLVKVKEVKCPADTRKMLNLRIVTYAGNQQISTTTENPTSVNTNWNKQTSTLSSQRKSTEAGEFDTFTIRVTEFVSYRRGVILDEIMRHMNTYCYDVSKNILEIECPAQLDTVPTIDKMKLPSFVSYTNVQHLPEPMDQNNIIVTDPTEKACYVLVKVEEVQCPADTSKLLNLRIVTYAGTQQISTTTMTTTENPTSVNTNEFDTFTIRVTEFVSYRRGVILDEIMRHMNTYCYDVSKNILEIECPAQLDTVPTIDKTKIPSSASYKYVNHVPESIKLNNFMVTDPKQQTCYVLVKVKEVQCPADTSKLLNLRIVTYAGNQQISTTTITTTENPTSVNTNWNKQTNTLAPQRKSTEAGEYETFTIRITEFVSYRRGVILDEIMRHMNTYCYDVSKNILEIECPAQVDTVPTFDKTKLPSSVSYQYVNHIPESIKLDNFVVKDPKQQTCYVLVKVGEVQCPSDTSKLLNLRIVTYAGNQQIGTTTMTTTENPTSINTNWNKPSVVGYETTSTLASQTTNTEVDKFDTFTIRVTEFVSYRRGVILDEIMRHMNTYCYDVSKNILEIECPAQVDTVPTFDKTKLPSSVSYKYVNHIPESIKLNNFVVKDPKQQTCYVLVKVKEVQCPSDTSKLLNLRIVTYAGNQQIGTTTMTTTENPTSINTNWNKPSVVGYETTSTLASQTTNTEVDKFETFTIRVTEFVSYRRGVILDEIMRHINTYCYDVSKNILQINCPEQLDVVPTINKTKVPSSASYKYVDHVPESVKLNNFIVTDPIEKGCYVLQKVKEVPCPSDTSKLLNIRIVSYAGNQEAVNTTTTMTTSTVKPTSTTPMETFIVRITEFLSRRGAVLEGILRHMQVYCYEVLKTILQVPCVNYPEYIAEMDTASLPSDVETILSQYTPDLTDNKNVFVRSTRQNVCYVLTFVKKVSCPTYPTNLVNIRVVDMSKFINRITMTIGNSVTENISHDMSYGKTETHLNMNEIHSHTTSQSNTSSTLQHAVEGGIMQQIKNDSSTVNSKTNKNTEKQNTKSFMKMELINEIIEDLLIKATPGTSKKEDGVNQIKKELLLEIVEDLVKEVKEHKWIFKKYVDQNNITYCFKEIDDSILPEACPENTANLEFVSLTQEKHFLARYIDMQNMVHCVYVYNDLLKPTPCTSDTMNLPIVTPTNERPLLVKYIDNQKTIHCYLQYLNRLEHTTCPTNDLNEYLPEISMHNRIYVAQYVDHHKNRFCYEVHHDFIKKVPCPSHQLPSLYLSNEQSFIGKIEISKEVEFCYNVYKDHWKPTICPANTSQLPIIFSSSSNLYMGKMRDNRNQDFCYFVKENSLNPVPCPLDTSNLPVVTPSNGKSYVGRIVDANNTEFCYTVYEDSMEPIACQKDTSTLPYITPTSNQSYIGKMETAENGIQCFIVSNNIMKTISCPEELSNIPYVTLTDERPLLVKYIDNQKKVHCYLQYLSRLEHTTCPTDDSNLPEISMHNQVYVAQYVDYHKNRFCYEVHHDFIKKVPCPSHQLPSLYLSNEQMFVGKIEISKNIEFCYNVYKDHWKPTHCPANTAQLPIIFSSSSNLYMGKFRDNRNQDFCYFVKENSLNPVPCPLDTSSLPEVTPSNGKSYVGRIVDGQNREFCYTVYEDSMELLACQEDTSTLPYITPTSNQSYIGKMETVENGMQCFIVSKNTMKIVSCPEELSTIPYVTPTNDTGYLAKYVDLLGQMQCFMVYNNTIQNSVCPVDTSNLPLAPTQIIVDHLNQIKKNDENVIKTELINEIIEDLISNNSTPGTANELDEISKIKKELLLEIVDDLVKEEQNDEPKWIFKKYVDQNNITYCFKENDDSMLPEVCPENTANLEFVSLTKEKYFLARYIDMQNRVHCVYVYNNLLKPTPCQSDIMNLPIVSPTNERPLLVKYIDNQKKVHCYLQYLSRLEHTTCPTDDSNLPEISMHNQVYVAQYVDYHKTRFCYEVHHDFIKKVPCPSHQLPSLYLSNEQMFVGKIEISKNIEFCYNVYKDHWKPTNCPANTSQLPIIFSSSSDLYMGKIRDNRNQDFCYFVKENNLNPVPCPLDTSNLPVVTASNGKSYVGRIVDAQNREFCYTVYEDSMKPIVCQKDTSTLPIISLASEQSYIGKMETVENGMQCFIVSKNTMKIVSCPEELSTIPYVTPTNDTGYLAKYVDLLGQMQCFMVYNNTIQNSVCPVDTSNLPLAPTQIIVDHLNQIKKNDENVIKTELINEIIEDLISNNSTPGTANELDEISKIKKELLLEIVDDLVKEEQNDEPKWIFKKYVDQNNITYCFKENDDSILPEACPENTVNLEFVSLTQEKYFLARYIDMQNRVHCVYVYNNLLKPTPCTSDIMNLPIVSPTNERPLLVKYIDNQSKVHCYLQYLNRLEHTTCPTDDLNEYLPEISMHNQVYVAQYVDYHKNRFCYEVHDDFVKKVPCPSQQLPSLYLSNEQTFIGKVEISKDIEFCYNVYKDHWKPTHCPANTAHVPIIFSSTSSLHMAKITDKNNQDFCYFVNENNLNPVPCPLDTSNLPVVTPSNGKSYVGRIVDANNTEFCYTVYEDSMKPIACQKDTSTLPYISLDSDQSYIGKMETVENGIQCFVVSKNTMKIVSCPEELSNIPFVTPTDQTGYLAKYVDLLGQMQCFLVYNNTIQNTICPADTSNLPLAPTQIIVDHLNQIKKNDENVIKTELLNEIIEDLISNNSTPGTANELDEISKIKKELLLEIVDDLVKEEQNEEPKGYLKKYVDVNNITYCFKENDGSILPEACPENTDILESVTLTQEKHFLARYIDMQNRVHCVYVYNNLLKPTPCESDIMDLPIVSPTNERPLLVKYTDNQSKVHCYLQYLNRLQHTTCPIDDSYLPEISMHQQIYVAQYVDYHKNRFCYEVHDGFIKKVPCPAVPLPSLYLSNEQTFIGKIEISKDVEFCYNVYKDHWKLTHCPANTAQLPIIFSSSSNLYMGKIRDNRNQDFCYFVKENGLNPVPCPLDTSSLPVVTPSNGKSYVGRIVDAQNREFCYTVYEDSMEPIACPKDTSTLPIISLASDQSYIGKMETVENGIQCFVVSKNTMKTVFCPKDLATIPYVAPTDKIGYLAKYVDLLGQTKCFIVYKNSMKNAICPADTVILPLAPTSVNLWWYGKYVTAQNEIICLKIQGETRIRVPCTSNAYMLPTVENVDDLEVIPPNSVTLYQKEIRELIKVMCKDKFFTHFQKNNNSVALQKIRRFLP